MITTGRIRYAEMGCSDLARSVDFYRRLLGCAVADHPPTAFAPHADRPAVWMDAGSGSIKLVDAGAGGSLMGWRDDDLQAGLRHVGLRVDDVDAHASRLRDAGVNFTLGPLDAVGGVRIAFFNDPDGALLEIVEGHVHYDTTFAPQVARRQAEAVPDADAGPTFDHVAVTAWDLAATVGLYTDLMGFTAVGALVHSDDPRGFRIHYLAAEAGVLEVFTYQADRSPSPWSSESARLGLRGIGVEVDDLDDAVAALRAVGATTVPTPDAQGSGVLITDVNGVPWQIVPRS